MVRSSWGKVYEWQGDVSDISGLLSIYIQSYYAEVMLENQQAKKVVLSFSPETKK